MTVNGNHSESLNSELVEKEQRFRVIVENMAEAVITIDESGRIETFNRAAAEMFRYPPEEVIGNNIKMLMPEEMHDARDTGLQRYLATGEARAIGKRAIELPGKRKDGSHAHLLLSFSETRIAGRTQFVVVARDVSAQRIARDALAASEDRLRLALKGSRLALFEWDIETGMTYLSEEWSNIIGAPPGDTYTTFQELEKLVHPDDAPRLRQPIIEALKGVSSAYHTEHRVRTRSGEWKWIVSRGQIMRKSKDGRALKMIGTNADITERKEIEQKLEREHQLLNAILENIEAGIVACDGQGVLTLFNRATREFHGLPPEPLPPERWTEHYDLFHADGKTPMTTQFIPLFRALQGEEVHNAEMTIVPKHGAPPRVLLASGQPMYASDGTNLGAVVAMHDITERKQMERRLQALAQYDTLTGLSNRNQFNELIERAMARSRRNRSLMAVIFLDIDHFKTVNDTLGHAAGDKLLQTFADRLLQCVRTTDSVSRLGGDEFTIILENLHDRDDASEIAQKILAVMQSDIMLEGHRHQVTTSLGIAFYKGEDMSAHNLLKRADDALYRAKNAGRKTFHLAD